MNNHQRSSNTFGPASSYVCHGQAEEGRYSFAPAAEDYSSRASLEHKVVVEYKVVVENSIDFVRCRMEEDKLYWTKMKNYLIGTAWNFRPPFNQLPMKIDDLKSFTINQDQFFPPTKPVQRKSKSSLT